jgi:hypothetical protein
MSIHVFFNPNERFPMRKIEYPTGRTYDAPQVLKIEVLNSKTDESGWVDGLALFIDHSRYIAATVFFVSPEDTDKEIGKAVLFGYDRGDYCPKIYSHFAKD